MTPQQIEKASGGGFTNGLIDNVPGIAILRDKLYDKILSVPWVDSSAIRSVLSYSPDGAIWTPNYAISSPAWKSGVYTVADMSPNRPVWIDSLDKAVKWNEFNDWWRANIMPVLNQYGKNQSVLLQQAYDDVAFWDNLYKIDKFIADIPVNIANGASNMITGVFTKLIPVFIVTGVLFGAYIISRSQLRKMS